MTRTFARTRLLPIVFASLAVAGCAQMGGVVEGAKDVSKKGMYKLGLSDDAGSSPTRRSASSSSSGGSGAAVAEPEVADAGARQMMAEFAQDEVPHTLLRKPVADGRLTSRFGVRRNPTGFLKIMPTMHKGIDYAAAEGTPIYAAGDGVIDKLYVSSSYGNFIRIKHDNGFQSAYAHMAAFFDGLKEGDFVAKGQQIGTVGTTGRSTAPHLHYELMLNGKQVDPLF